MSEYEYVGTAKERFKQINEWACWNTIAVEKGKQQNHTVICCPCPDGSIEKGKTYVFFGKWQNHPSFGSQFRANSYRECEPVTRESMWAYLRTIKGFTKSRFDKIADMCTNFKWPILELLRTQPDKVGDIIANATKHGELYWKKNMGRSKGLNPLDTEWKHIPVKSTKTEKQCIEWAHKVSKILTERHDTLMTDIALHGIFDRRGFPHTLVESVKKKWKAKAPDIIRRNPFSLLQFKGAGFLRCDKMYLDFKLPKSARKRAALAVAYYMERDANGHTWWTEEHCLEIMAEFGIDPDATALTLGLRASLFETKNGNWALKKFADEEQTIAAAVDRLAYDYEWPLELSGLSNHQSEEVKFATRQRIGILTGSAGTGKTYCVCQIVAELIGQGKSVAVVAPTGKAAVRITEEMQNAGVDLKARTIHSYLEPLSVDGATWTFRRDESNPTTDEYVIIDEASMITTSLLASLLSATPYNAKVLIVGDPNQLPPIGHGAPLRDIIAAYVPCGELTEIRRNSGLIVETCAAIRDQKELCKLPDTVVPDQGINLVLHRFRGPKGRDHIVNITKEVFKRDPADAQWNMQIITPLNKGSPMSREELNMWVRREINRENECPDRFWPGDKVICTKNSTFSNKNGEEYYVANGDIGQITEVHLYGDLVLRLKCPDREVIIPRSQIDKLDLAYAITVHKAQGSQAPLIIVAVDDCSRAQWIKSRPWLYTAISRAQQVCVLVGDQSDINRIVKRNPIVQRRTMLREQIVWLDFVKELSF